jgi:hypothetical protein
MLLELGCARLTAGEITGSSNMTAGIDFVWAAGSAARRAFG